MKEVLDLCPRGLSNVCHEFSLPSSQHNDVLVTDNFPIQCLVDFSCKPNSPKLWFVLHPPLAARSMTPHTSQTYKLSNFQTQKLSLTGKLCHVCTSLEYWNLASVLVQVAPCSSFIMYVKRQKSPKCVKQSLHFGLHSSEPDCLKNDNQAQTSRCADKLPTPH